MRITLDGGTSIDIDTDDDGNVVVEITVRGNGGSASATKRTCANCGISLEGYRRQARYCGGPCRAEASRNAVA